MVGIGKDEYLHKDLQEFLIGDQRRGRCFEGAQ